MFGTILVPLDGSVASEHALPFALAVATSSGASLRLLHVHEPLVKDGIATFDSVVDQRQRHNAANYLKGVVERLGAPAEVHVDTVLTEGQVTATIAETAATSRADLVVMSTHGHGPLSRLWLGSVADEFVRCSPIPVLLIRARDGQPRFGEALAFRQILVPLDGTSLAERVLELAIALGTLWRAEYTLLQVVKPVQVVGLDLTGYAIGALDLPLLEQLQIRAKNYLERIAEQMRQRSLRVRTRVEVAPHPAQAIVDESRRNGIDLIALESRGRGGLTRLLLGSVADKVLRASAMPVLIHRALPSST